MLDPIGVCCVEPLYKEHDEDKRKRQDSEIDDDRRQNEGLRKRVGNSRSGRNRENRHDGVDFGTERNEEQDRARVDQAQREEFDDQIAAKNHPEQANTEEEDRDGHAVHPRHQISPRCQMKAWTTSQEPMKTITLTSRL